MAEKVRTRILARRLTGGDYYLLTLGNPIAAAVRPGQFVMVGLADAADPFLKRPYSIYRSLPPSTERPEGELVLLIKRVGKGSAQTASVPVGTAIDIIGPLGQPFAIPEGSTSALFVAGGVGVAPFIELAATLAGKGMHIQALIGGRSEVDLQGIGALEELGVTVRCATEDGSAGTSGRVTTLLEDAIEAGLPEGTQLYVCGPDAMMKAVGAIAQRAGLPCQLSLEAVMGCGFGVCLGCVVKDNHGEFVRVCKEGPVIPADRLQDYGFGDIGDGEVAK